MRFRSFIFIAALALAACSTAAPPGALPKANVPLAVPAGTTPLATTAPGTVAVGGRGFVKFFDRFANQIRALTMPENGTVKSMTFDRNGNLYVAIEIGIFDHRVLVYPPGETAPSLDIRGVADPESLTVDPNGYLYVAEGAAGRVAIYKPGETGRYKEITGLFSAYGSVYGDGIFWATGAGFVTDDIEGYYPGSTTLLYKITKDLQNPRGLAFNNGKLIALNLGSTVKKVASRITAYDYRSDSVYHAYWDVGIIALTSAYKNVFFLARKATPDDYVAVCYLEPKPECNNAIKINLIYRDDISGEYVMAWDNVRQDLWILGKDHVYQTELVHGNTGNKLVLKQIKDLTVRDATAIVAMP